VAALDPWFRDEENPRGVVDTDGRTVAEIPYSRLDDATEVEERRALVSAAPDLLTACVEAERLIRLLPSEVVEALRESSAFEEACEVRVHLEEAIAKAEGSDDE
jgi:hypothetical protein